jgi:hypothetical protein
MYANFLKFIYNYFKIVKYLILLYIFTYNLHLLHYNNLK